MYLLHRRYMDCESLDRVMSCESAGICCAGQLLSTFSMADFSLCVTHREYFCFTPIWRATYEQWYPVFDGSHCEASPSLFSWFAGPSTASRL